MTHIRQTPEVKLPRPSEVAGMIPLYLPPGLSEEERQEIAAKGGQPVPKTERPGMDVFWKLRPDLVRDDGTGRLIAATEPGEELRRRYGTAAAHKIAVLKWTRHNEEQGLAGQAAMTEAATRVYQTFENGAEAARGVPAAERGESPRAARTVKQYLAPIADPEGRFEIYTSKDKNSPFAYTAFYAAVEDENAKRSAEGRPDLLVGVDKSYKSGPRGSFFYFAAAGRDAEGGKLPAEALPASLLRFHTPEAKQAMLDAQARIARSDATLANAALSATPEALRPHVLVAEGPDERPGEYRRSIDAIAEMAARDPERLRACLKLTEEARREKNVAARIAAEAGHAPESQRLARELRAMEMATAMADAALAGRSAAARQGWSQRRAEPAEAAPARTPDRPRAAEPVRRSTRGNDER